MMAGEMEDGCGLQLAIQYRSFAGRNLTAVVLRDNETVADVTYSTNRLVDGIACVSAVIAFFLPFAMLIVFFSSLPFFVQMVLNPLHPAAGPLWLWGAGITCLGSLAYLISLFVLQTGRSRMRIRAQALTMQLGCEIVINERRSISPCTVKADVVIAGRHQGVIHGMGRSLFTLRGVEDDDISFLSTSNHGGDRESMVSTLLVLIGIVFNSVAVPSRRRLQQFWTIEQAGETLGWLEYKRSLPPQYQMRLVGDGKARELEVLAVALLLAKPVSSGSIESFEELH